MKPIGIKADNCLGLRLDDCNFRDLRAGISMTGGSVKMKGGGFYDCDTAVVISDSAGSSFEQVTFQSDRDAAQALLQDLDQGVPPAALESRHSSWLSARGIDLRARLAEAADAATVFTFLREIAGQILDAAG